MYVGASAFHKSLWPEIIRRYEMGEKVKAISEGLGVDRKTVYNVARRAGLPNRHICDPARTARIVLKYREGIPVREIARSEAVHRTYVRNVARKAGLPAREDWGRKYPIDHEAFDEPDAVGWWLIGLLAADGSVGRGNLVSLTQTGRDVDVLHAFLEYVSCPDRPLTHLKLSPEAARRAWPRSPAYEARIWSASIRGALERHGLRRNKTKRLCFSREAADNPAVWLGLLDGDGWVSTGGPGRGPLIDFCGTPAVMSQCSEFWGARLSFQRRKAPTVRRHRAGLARVALHGPNAVRGARILLGSSPVSLQRKRRTLEAIASTTVGEPSSTPQRMRTSGNSNQGAIEEWPERT